MRSVLSGLPNFVSGVTDLARRQARRSTALLMGVGLAGLLAWAGGVEIDQTVRAQGQLIPTVRNRVIQAADGGVLSRILVQEGQMVQAGQALATLERELTQRLRSLREELATLQDGQDLARQALEMNEAQLKTGDASRIEVMRARRQLGELQGRASVLRSRYLQESSLEVAKLANDLSSRRYKLDERQSLLDYTLLQAPVAGIVTRLKVGTPGVVLSPGDELMQIAPTDGELLLELKLDPVDIGGLKTGLPVRVNLDAFDHVVYGSLQGQLSYLSPATLTEPSANGPPTRFHRAQVLLGRDGAKGNARLAEVELQPGMTATVDILADSQSVLTCLSKTVFKAFAGALDWR